MSNRPSEEYLFAVIGSPARPASAEPKPMRLWAATEYIRAAPGGTGAAKCGGNYGGAFIAQQQAAANGCDQVVWLDARDRRYIEEAGGSNLFFVESTTEGPRLRTPPLSGTLLAGVTRDSILRLAGSLGYPVAEEPLTLDEWEQGCRGRAHHRDVRVWHRPGDCPGRARGLRAAGMAGGGRHSRVPSRRGCWTHCSTSSTARLRTNSAGCGSSTPTARPK